MRNKRISSPLTTYSKWAAASLRQKRRFITHKNFHFNAQMTNLPQKQHQKWANYLRLSPVPISCITPVTQCHLKTLSQTSRKYFTEPRRLSHPTRPVSPCLEPPFQIITPMTTRRTKCSLSPSSASARHARLVFPRPTIPSHQRDSTSSSSSTPVAIDFETLISIS